MLGLSRLSFPIVSSIPGEITLSAALQRRENAVFFGELMDQSSKIDSGWACLTSSRLITELGTLGWEII
jgi:hypothetical protein